MNEKQIEEIAERYSLEYGSQCPNCYNTGSYAVADENGDAEEQQCEYCFTVDGSIFNLRRMIFDAITEAIQLQSAKIAELEAENEKLKSEVGALNSALEGEIDDHRATQSELTRIREGVKGLETERVQLNSSLSQPIVEVVFKRDLDNLMEQK